MKSGINVFSFAKTGVGPFQKNPNRGLRIYFLNKRLEFLGLLLEIPDKKQSKFCPFKFYKLVLQPFLEILKPKPNTSRNTTLFLFDYHFFF